MSFSSNLVIFVYGQLCLVFHNVFVTPVGSRTSSSVALLLHHAGSGMALGVTVWAAVMLMSFASGLMRYVLS